MSTTVVEKLREGILDYAKREAKKMVNEAEKKAKEIIEEAKRTWEARKKEEERKILGDAKRRAEEILVEAKIKARMNIAKAKNQVIQEAMEAVKRKLLSGNYDRRKSLENLLKESLDAIGYVDVIVYVRSSDIDVIKSIVKKEKLKQVKEIKVNDNIIGGVIVESIDKTMIIDNSYDSRLKAIESRMLQILSRELFK